MEILAIDTDIPFAEYPPTFESLEERVNAAFNSLAETYERVPVTDEDISNARAVFTGREKPTNKILSSPGTVVHLKAILDEYDKVVIQSAAQLRTYVTNRLIQDSNSTDPRIRLKCYELLGKISDVGLFTEKTEVTLKHRPTEELEQLLRERLMKTLNGADLVSELPPEVSKAPPVDAAIDVELLSDPAPADDAQP